MTTAKSKKPFFERCAMDPTCTKRFGSEESLARHHNDHLAEAREWLLQDLPPEHRQAVSLPANVDMLKKRLGRRYVRHSS